MLMPALGRAKEQATAVVCQSRLKQWSIIWALYTQDSDGYFHPGHCPGESHPLRMSRLWYYATYKYYQGQDDILFCPAATGPISDMELAWQKGIWGPPPPDYSGRLIYGSYGLNQWIASPIDQNPTIGDVSMYWKTPGVKNASDVPVMGDSCYCRVFPRYIDTPPPYELAMDQGTAGGYRPLSQFCINRHNGEINLLFADWSVRKVGLKSLWNYNWRRNWNFDNAPPPIWPSWMRKFKD